MRRPPHVKVFRLHCHFFWLQPSFPPRTGPAQRLQARQRRMRSMSRSTSRAASQYPDRAPRVTQWSHDPTRPQKPPRSPNRCSMFGGVASPGCCLSSIGLPPCVQWGGHGVGPPLSGRSLRLKAPAFLDAARRHASIRTVCEPLLALCTLGSDQVGCCNLCLGFCSPAVRDPPIVQLAVTRPWAVRLESRDVGTFASPQANGLAIASLLQVAEGVTVVVER